MGVVVEERRDRIAGTFRGRHTHAAASFLLPNAHLRISSTLTNAQFAQDYSLDHPALGAAAFEDEVQVSTSTPAAPSSTVFIDETTVSIARHTLKPTLRRGLVNIQLGYRAARFSRIARVLGLKGGDKVRLSLSPPLFQRIDGGTRGELLTRMIRTFKGNEVRLLSRHSPYQPLTRPHLCLQLQILFELLRVYGSGRTPADLRRVSSRLNGAHVSSKSVEVGIDGGRSTMRVNLEVDRSIEFGRLRVGFAGSKFGGVEKIDEENREVLAIHASESSKAFFHSSLANQPNRWTHHLMRSSKFKTMLPSQFRFE